MSNTIDPSLLLSTYQKEQRKTGSNTMGKDDFLKILITQLQNQDPTSPMEDREFIAQMAQFSTLEQMTNLNSTMEKFIDSQTDNKLIAYSEFVGKEITWHRLTASEDDPTAPPEVEEGTGKVVSLQFKENQVYFILEDGTTLEPGNVSQINANSAENNLLSASMLIGKTVTYKSENEELTAQVKSVSFKNGKTQFLLDNEASITSSNIIKIE